MKHLQFNDRRISTWLIRTCLMIFCSCFFYQNVYSGNIQWYRFLTDTTLVLNAWDLTLHGSAVDSQGNIYLCYINRGDVQNSLSTVMKLSSDGKKIWERPIFPAQNNGRTIIWYESKFVFYVDSNQNLILGGAINDSMVANTYRYLFLKKWTTSGFELASSITPLSPLPPYDSTLCNTRLSDMKVMKNGDIFFCHYFILNGGGFSCDLIGFNKNFNQIFSKKIKVGEKYFHPYSGLMMALNDTSLTLAYSISRGGATMDNYLLQFSLTTGDTNWIRKDSHTDNAREVCEISIFNNQLFTTCSVLRRYTMDGQLLDSSSIGIFRKLSYDSTSAVILGYKHFYNGNYEICRLDTNFNVLNSFVPIYDTGTNRFIVTMIQKDTFIYVYSVSQTAPVAFFSMIQIAKYSKSGILLEKIDHKPPVLLSYVYLGNDALMDKNGNIVVVTGLYFCKDVGTNNQKCAYPLYAFSATFDTLYNISGTVFLDTDSNCLNNTVEKGIQGNIVHLMPEDVYTVTDSNGFYHFLKQQGTSNIEYIPYLNGLDNCIVSGNHTFTTNNYSISDSLDFPMKIVDQTSDGECNLFSGPSRRGYNQAVYIYTRNNSASILSQPLLTLVFDSNYTFHSANPSPDSMNGNHIYWRLDSMMPGQFKNFDVLLNATLSNIVVGDTFRHSISLNSIADSIYVANNVDSSIGVVTGSYDPNHKIVNPIGEGAEGFVENSTTLKYYVEFQNTGNDTALNIHITDELDDDLDISTFKLLGSSDPMYYTLQNRKLTFYFDNIMLPDSNKSYDQSIGYLAYSIKPRKNSLGKEIKNKANIYFDFNEPIVTNTTLNTIGLPGGKLKWVSDKLNIAPNPAFNERVKVFVDLAISGITQIELFDLNGRSKELIYKGYLEKGPHVFYLSVNQNSIPNLYFLKLSTELRTMTSKLIY